MGFGSCLRLRNRRIFVKAEICSLGDKSFEKDSTSKKIHWHASKRQNAKKVRMLHTKRKGPVGMRIAQNAAKIATANV